MAYRCDRPNFTVTVTSGFISRSQWAVDAVVEYRLDGPAGNRRELATEARTELMIGIAREFRRGRAAGASTVVVLVEGDPEIAGFFRGPEDYRRAAHLVRHGRG